MALQTTKGLDDENKIPEEKRNCVDSFVEAVDHIVSGRVL